MKQINPQPQEKFLNAVRKQKLSVTIFLVNGVKLTGIVVEFDTFIIKLKKDKNIQMIYKHSISTISSPEFIDFSDDNNEVNEIKKI